MVQLKKKDFKRQFYDQLILFSHFQGVRSRSADACASKDPCQNGAECISTDNGPICDCSKIDFKGLFCDQGKFCTTV